jgi:2-phosphosulfolactate phosphatase
MPNPVVLDVAFLPGELGSLAGRVAIVLDVLRATSTIVTLLDRGCASIGLAESVEAARGAAQSAGRDVILCGEVGGLPPYGFDYGNSPSEFARLDMAGKHALMATTNGTAAVRACREAPAVLIGALLNANALIRETFELLRTLDGVVIVCSGREGRFVLDDSVAAGYLCHVLLNEARVRNLPVVQSNSANAAYRLYHSYPNLLAALNESDSGQNLYPLRLEADVSFCAKTSTTKRVPRLGAAQWEGLYLL